MNQEKIWAYFQNEGIASFEAALPRYTYLQRKVQRLVDEPGHILNIGVGSGKLEGLLVDSGYAVAALDPDSSAIDKLVTMGINARVGVAQNLPFQDESFDAVVASEVLEHLDVEDCRKAISEIRRVLKSGGDFIGTVPYQEPLADNLTICPHCGERFHRWGHRQSFDKTQLAALYIDGFEAVQLTRRAFVAWSPRPMRFVKSVVKYVLGRMGEQVAIPHFYFECRKKAK